MGQNSSDLCIPVYQESWNADMRYPEGFYNFSCDVTNIISY